MSVNSGRYLPRRIPARQISTTIHLHLSEWLLIIREIKGPPRRWRQECHKFAYLSTKNNNFARFAWAISLNISRRFSRCRWRQMTCFEVVWTTWVLDNKFLVRSEITPHISNQKWPWYETTALVKIEASLTSAVFGRLMRNHRRNLLSASPD